jgi:hypothetical protein
MPGPMHHISHVLQRQSTSSDSDKGRTCARTCAHPMLVSLQTRLRRVCTGMAPFQQASRLQRCRGLAAVDCWPDPPNGNLTPADLNLEIKRRSASISESLTGLSTAYEASGGTGLSQDLLNAVWSFPNLHYVRMAHPVRTMTKHNDGGNSLLLGAI